MRMNDWRFVTMKFDDWFWWTECDMNAGWIRWKNAKILRTKQNEFGVVYNDDDDDDNDVDVCERNNSPHARQR